MSLFKKFEPKPDLGPATALKSSVRRVIRQKLTEQYPALAKDEGALLEAAWPNKASVTTMKFAREHVQMFIAEKQVLFFQHYDDWYLPSLRLLHKCLTSAGGKLPDPSKGEEPLKKGQCVAIRAQGKDEILAVGVLSMDTEEVRATGKGIAIENIHYLGDDLWMTLSKGGI
ncbi:translation machinery-associated protein [Pseudozyma hubeiensis SY62]|uniref:Translation machinery-associated protein 20 n=1 Tax=Pseudozyma hubeiensis (strain SY62) TaxID=1305764 RepID=R9NYS1_PSEHS|nr:translation machinery-associated protein [Pseudozyma hubeiensis SY62]GAC93973.1 translation machinery-associated protein [Pseudozyma hubeiensis SY62]